MNRTSILSEAIDTTWGTALSSCRCDGRGSPILTPDCIASSYFWAYRDSLRYAGNLYILVMRELRCYSQGCALESYVESDPPSSLLESSSGLTEHAATMRPPQIPTWDYTAVGRGHHCGRVIHDDGQVRPQGRRSGGAPTRCSAVAEEAETGRPVAPPADEEIIIFRPM